MEKNSEKHTVFMPIGCDCHPAYLLTSLGLREKSMPFDWLDTHPLEGLDYVYDNIINDFEYFLKDLRKNNDQKVFATRYHHSVFFHHPEVIEKKEVYDSYLRRILRFSNNVKFNHCLYFYGLDSNALLNNDDVTRFLKSIHHFREILKEDDHLLIYLRHEEDYDENKKFCDHLIAAIKEWDDVHMVPYLRQRARFGVWGDETMYSELLAKFGIEVNLTQK